MDSKSTNQAKRTDSPKPRPSSDGILASAEKTFAAHGYGDTSLRQLMAEAGVSTTAFYSRFAGKEAVLQALVDRLLQDLQAAAVDALANSKDPGEIIERAVEAMVAALADHRALVATALSEGSAVAGVRNAIATAYEVLVQIIGSRLGGPRETRNAMAWAFVGSLQIQVQRWAVFRDLEREDLERELTAVSLSLATTALSS